MKVVAFNEDLQRIVNLFSEETISNLFMYVTENQVIKDFTYTKHKFFDFKYRYFSEHNLIVIYAFKHKKNENFVYCDRFSVDFQKDLFRVITVENFYLDSNSLI